MSNAIIKQQGDSPGEPSSVQQDRVWVVDPTDGSQPFPPHPASPPQGEEAQPDDDAGQDDDDEGATPGPTAGLPASVAPPGYDVRPAPQRVASNTTPQ
jgi:hypothetical protein